MSEGQAAALLLWVLLLTFSLRGTLLRTLYHNPLYQHLCLGGAIVLVPPGPCGPACTRDWRCTFSASPA